MSLTDPVNPGHHMCKKSQTSVKSVAIVTQYSVTGLREEKIKPTTEMILVKKKPLNDG
jgi:hypothetical protein